MRAPRDCIVNDAAQRGAGRTDPVRVSDAKVRERGSRYIDFVVPGLLGMTIMGGGIWGLGYSIVDQRRKNLLKRLVATPMSRAEYLGSYVISRLVMLTIEVGVLLGFSIVLFDVPMRGSLGGDGDDHRHLGAGVRRLGTAHRVALEDDRGRVGHDESRDAADVGAVGRVLLVREFSARGAADHQGASAHRGERCASRNDASRRRVVGARSRSSRFSSPGDVVCFAIALRIFRWR